MVKRSLSEALNQASEAGGCKDSSSTFWEALRDKGWSPHEDMVAHD
jgi:hypothetical protein